MWTALAIAVAVTAILFILVVLFCALKSGAEADERADQLLELLQKESTKFLN